MAYNSVVIIGVGLSLILIVSLILLNILEQSSFFANTASFFANNSCYDQLKPLLGISASILCTLFKDMRMLVVVMVVLGIFILILRSVRRPFFDSYVD